MDPWTAQLRDYEKKTDLNAAGHQRQTSSQSCQQSRNKFGNVENKGLDKCVALLSKMLDKEGNAVSYSEKMSLVSKSKKGGKKAAKPVSVKTKAVAKIVAQKSNMKPDVKKGQRRKCSSKQHSSETNKTEGKTGDKKSTDTPESSSLVPSEALVGLKRNDNFAMEVLYGKKFDTASRPLQPFKPAVSSDVPFNQRLPCSTPVEDVVLLQPGSSSAAAAAVSSASASQDSSYHLTYAGNNPLNSSDQVKLMAPPQTIDNGPKFTPGQVEFLSNPLADNGHLSPYKSTISTGNIGDFSLYSDTVKTKPFSASSSTAPVLFTSGVYQSATASSGAHTLPGVTPAYTCGDSAKAKGSEVNDQFSDPVIESFVPSGIGQMGVKDKSSRVAESGLTGGNGCLDMGDDLLTGGIDARGSSAVSRDTDACNVRVGESDHVQLPLTDVSFDHDSTLTETLDAAVITPAVNVKPVITANKKVQMTTKGKGTKQNLRPQRQVASTGTQVKVETPADDKRNKCSEPTTSTDTGCEDNVTAVKKKADVKTKTKKGKSIQRVVKELQRQLKQQSPLVKQLVNEVIEAADGLPSAKDRKLEMDLAMQPLRSENAQLKRQLRIACQQIRDKEDEICKAKQPDTNFQVVHLEMVKLSLEKAVKQEQSVSERHKQRVSQLQAEVDKVLSEKQQLLDIINLKDSEALTLSSQLTSEKQKLTRECEKLSHDVKSNDGKMEAMKAEQQKMRLEVKHKQQEVDKLQKLVGSLQLSMTRLLHDLQSSQPDPVQSIGHLSDGLQKIETTLHEEFSIRDPTISAFSSYPSTTQQEISDMQSTAFKPVPETNLSSACRALTFDKAPTFETAPPHFLSSENAENRVSESNITDGFVPVQDSHARPYDIDVTVSDYNLPAGASPFTKQDDQGSPPERENRGSGFTVKDLLTPLAGRMQEFRRITSAGTEKSSGTGGTSKPVEAQVAVPEETFSDIHSLPSDESTLTDEAKTEDKRLPAPGKMTDVSRFSFTDYFKKYPKESATGGEVAASVTQKLSGNHEQSSPSSDPSWGSRSLPTKSSRSLAKSRPSVQDSLYRGTQLDTSISTITDGTSEAASVSSGLSSCSITSADDRIFKEGLANLDANISRMQNQLRLAALS